MLSGGPLLWLVTVAALTGASDAAQEAAPAQRPHVKPDSAAPEPAPFRRAEGVLMLDYQLIRVPQESSLDLLGLHALTRLTDWLYAGVGVHAPLVKGEYGGFMAFDVTAHAQRRIWRSLFADAGLSIGGGGGGKSKEQSRVLTGSGGFAKAYAGLGYDFADFSVGANVSRMKFYQSIIDSTQVNVFVQVPFSSTVGSYASAGRRLAATDAQGALADSSENTLTLGLDNLVQIDPEGSNKSTIGLIDLQFAHYLTASTYWYASFAAGYRGLPLYNQLVGGLGHRFKVSPRVDLHAQLGIGSGGWSPDRIDTGAGLLVYPKATAEVALGKNFGLALSAGYLFAPTGSSKNYTLGASLNYHLLPDAQPSGARESSEGILFRGYRIGLFQQTALHVRDRDVVGGRISMLSAQLDAIVGDHVYIPIQGAVAYEAYREYPGYGELLAGVGLQSKNEKDNPLQFFGQLLGGTNAHGPVVKASVGVNVGLGDRLALYASIGKTIAAPSNKTNFRSDNLGLGLTYRFSMPGG
ncbi:MAG: hypothetical protein HS128_24160 [Ideonella sp.]|nr:MAG: hypothetical protein F9K36_14130 [Burkholderiaceae bacterium]MBE7420801.1 hypothetical protein [Ideonella sp.]